MGAEARTQSPPLTLTESSLGDEAAATDLSRRSEKTSFSIPEDGSPLTIDTDKRQTGVPASQTSLLIEFFEGSKNPKVTPSSKPSVRVRVTPPGKSSARDHAQTIELDGTEQPAYTQRISLKPGESRVEHLDDDESSVAARHTDIDVAHRHLGSDLSGTSVSHHEYYSNLPSEVSSMPPESALEPTPPAELTPKKVRSLSPSYDDVEMTKETLHAPKGKEAAVSREQLTQKVIEKLGQEPRKVSSGKGHSSKSRSRSVSKEHLAESTSSPRRRSGKHRRSSGEHTSDPSLLTASQISESRSHRSGTSKSSVNPKLVEAVDDAIRRLILPELSLLKREQKTQKNLEKFEQIEKGRRGSSASSASREELGRRWSKHSSDPDVRIRSKRRSHKHSSPKDRYEREASEDTVIREDSKALRRRSKDKDSHRLRDAAAGALIGGVLTREALKHHDSQSSMERRERRRRRSGKSTSRSHSRHDSTADTDELFQKHDVPPMPMRSELTGSDLTRDSILSERTSTPTSAHRRHEIRQIARKDPRKANSPIDISRHYDDTHLIEKDRGVVHDDIAVHHANVHDDYDHRGNMKSGLTGAALGAATAGALSSYRATGAHYYDELDDHPYGGGHTLSPIQSVASFEEAADDLQKGKLRRVHSTGSLESLEQHHLHEAAREATREGARSVDSISLDDTHVGKTRRRGMVFEGTGEALRPHSFRSSDAQSYGHQYHDSLESGSLRNPKHLSMNTNPSEAVSYADNASAAQEIRDVAANAEYIGTPHGVESAVASLLDLDSAGNTRVDDDGQSDPMDLDYDYGSREMGDVGSPLKHELRQEDIPTRQRQNFSPRQSAASPLKDHARSSRGYRDRYSDIPLTHSGVPDANDPLPEIGHYDSKSDISTNPSYIQGTAGGEKEPWLLNRSRDKVKSESGSGHDSLKDAARNMLLAASAGAGAAALGTRGARKSPGRERGEPREQPRYYEDDDEEDRDMRREEMFTPQKLDRQSPLGEDEGYATGAREPTPPLTPVYRGKDMPAFSAGPLVGGIDEEDPFISTHRRSMSGTSHGMGSPLYDGAMGKGINNIQSKDIVALMNHLTVRDAQRSARDTEMLATLVSSATELRTGFEDMKRFIQDQDELLVEVANKQHEQTQRVVNGPRPLPASTTFRGSSEDFTEDVPQKRRSAFRRAFKGFGGRNNNDIARLEQMMTHLLDEIAELKAAQGLETTAAPRKEPYQTTGLTSYENLRDGRSGYEPEGQAGTGSAANSGYFSNPSLRQTSGQGFSRHRPSENRVSTVLEAEEENDAPLEPHEQQVLGLEDDDQFTTPTRATRQTSVPLASPPAAQANQGPASAENTPRTEKSKKHKSTSSSFLPKFSRWSRTTASTVAENFRNSTRRDRPTSEISQSGSDVQNFDVMESYDPNGDDRIRSRTSLNQDRPSSPLVPSALSDKPTYQVHRDSLNLQHPQPRQGPTARFQNHLESQVQDRSPVSPSSDQFGSNPILARFGGVAGNRYSGHSGAGNLSPISDKDQTPPPPRPPKIRDEGPLIPPKVPLDDASPTTGGRVAPAVSAAKTNLRAPALTRSPNQRKPSGPRPLSSSRSFTPDRLASARKVEETSY